MCGEEKGKSRCKRNAGGGQEFHKNSVEAVEILHLCGHEGETMGQERVEVEDSEQRSSSWE